MSTITLTSAKRVALLLIVVSLIFYLTNVPSTYSHFTSRAGPVELVLQTGHWETEADITIEQADPPDQLGMMSDNSEEALTAKRADEEENRQEESTKPVTIAIKGPWDIVIPAKGDVEAVYSLTVNDEYNVLPDHDVRWMLSQEVDGVALDQGSSTIIVSSEAKPGCVTLVATVGPGEGYKAEMIIALLESAAEKNGTDAEDELNGGNIKELEAEEQLEE